eukprot:2046995-Rhodomonas_salina.1
MVEAPLRDPAAPPKGPPTPEHLLKDLLVRNLGSKFEKNRITTATALDVLGLDIPSRFSNIRLPAKGTW